MTTERTSALTAKKEALEIIQKLPDDSTMADVLYQLDFQLAVRRGIEEADRGELITQEEVEKHMGRWLKSAGR